MTSIGAIKRSRLEEDDLSDIRKLMATRNPARKPVEGTAVEIYHEISDGVSFGSLSQVVI